MEMVDIIDEQNNVLYQSSKQDAHEKGLLHRTVIAEIQNSKGEWVLVQQAGDKQDAGQYVSPVGGHVTAGETEVEALQRETEEEVGLLNVQYKRIGDVIFNRESRGKIENHLFILYEIYTDDELVLNEESVGYKRFTEAELKKLLKKTPDMFGNAYHVIVKSFYPHLLEI